MKSYRNSLIKNNNKEEQTPLFDNSDINQLPAVLNPTQASTLLGISVSTFYKWSSLGYLTKCCRKRGNHLFINKEKLLEVVFDGPSWERKD